MSLYEETKFEWIVAPSTWLKNALTEKTGEKFKTDAHMQKLIKLLDEELLNGLADHTQKKWNAVMDKENKLRYLEAKLEADRENLESREKRLEEEKNAMGELKNERARDAYLFAQKMVGLLEDKDSELQTSMSYIMWAYLGGKGKPGKDGFIDGFEEG